jgi:hypothetical protein
MTTGAPVRNTEEKFWDMVEPTGFCWLWAGRKSAEGYAAYWLNGHTRPVHHIAFELLLGETPPPGMHLDHLCRTRHCVNPDHLEVVTPAANSRRANLPKMTRTHCTHGHEWTPENTLPMPESKRCRQCILVRGHIKKGIDCTYDRFCSADSHKARRGLADTCKRGHSMADAYVRKDTGHRNCATCIRERAKKATQKPKGTR